VEDWEAWRKIMFQHDTDQRTREGGSSSQGPKKIDLMPEEAN